MEKRLREPDLLSRRSADLRGTHCAMTWARLACVPVYTVFIWKVLTQRVGARRVCCGRGREFNLAMCRSLHSSSAKLMKQAVCPIREMIGVETSADLDLSAAQGEPEIAPSDC